MQLDFILLSNCTSTNIDKIYHTSVRLLRYDIVFCSWCQSVRDCWLSVIENNCFLIVVGNKISSMRVSKSASSACAFAHRMRRFLMASDEQAVVSARESHSGTSAKGGRTKKSPSSHSPQVASRERSLKNIFVRPSTPSHRRYSRIYLLKIKWFDPSYLVSSPLGW